MTEFHFDCVFYYVNNLETAVAFYRNVLGLKLTSRDIVARFDVDGVLFELVPNPGPEEAERGNGNARLVLKVEDIDEAVDFLGGQSVPVTHIQKVENGRLAKFKDPDGNEVCVWQYD
jgi:predicted enzyme related to lactoylglutathione lyase